jgi:copper(I)-binding protein
MFMNLSKPLHKRDAVPVTLTFEGPDKEREQLQIKVPVRDITGAAQGLQHMQYSH